MTTSSCSCFTPTKNINSHKNGGKCSSLHSRNHLQLLHKSPTKGSSNKDLIVRNIAVPEATADLVSSSAGGDLLSSFSLPTLPSFSHSPWVVGIAGLMVGVPVLIQWLLKFTKEVDMVAEAVEKIADTVGKVAEEADQAVEDLAEAVPEGGLKQIANFVEDLAEETTKDAHKVEDLMNKVEELEEKLDQVMENESKGNENA